MAKKPNFEGLTADQIKFIKGLEKMHLRMGGNTRRSRTIAKWMVEHQRLFFLAETTLTELRKTDPATYFKVAAIVHDHNQEFLDAVNAALEGDSMEMHLDSRVALPAPSDLVFGGLMTNDGFSMRARLIEWLSGKPSGAKLLPILKDLQKILPELKPGEGADF